MNLSRSEEQLVHYLWTHPRSTLKQLISYYPDPKPAKTTVATLLRRMADKGYIGFIQDTSARKYYVLEEKRSYFNKSIGRFIHQFFNDSAQQFASYFTEETNLTDEELLQLRDLIDQKLNQEK